VTPTASVAAVEAARTADTAAEQAPDPESRRWLADLRSDGRSYDEAVERLHALLLRAARHEVARRRGGLPALRGEELEDVALQAAHDALVSVLARLYTYRGLSRFTTWAYKFALLEAAVALRRRAWQGRELTLEPESWDVFASASDGPSDQTEQGELLTAVQQGIGEALTPHQRRVLIALAIDGVPVDVLADRLGTTRGALYKTLHDARRKLRGHLAAQGLALSGEES
jgi:RNA polymerase sigma-70 factor (ECF subfamily)